MDDTTYFTLEELTRSRTADRLGIDNRPDSMSAQNLHRLIDKVLDPLRRRWGAPLIVNSGFRCPKLNKAVGGAPNSHHLRGMAADITTGNRLDNRRLFHLAAESELQFTQLIDEASFAWIHISYDPSDLRRQILRL